MWRAVFQRVVLTLAALLATSTVLRAEWPELRTRDPKRQEPLKAKLALIPKTHPRIFIRSDADLDPVRSRIKSSPEVAEAYAALRDWAYSGEWTNGGLAAHPPTPGPHRRLPPGEARPQTPRAHRQTGRLAL